ncbi:PTS sugar transporter subunit IIB [Lentilactobacillus sp. Marseille-Q4993]|uniref:PTS system mannose/fructose/N-acetylgalactosamine-transporter subunit IIB n=1 Tax=Lentilactobacillus sp. Marseille-Q4993 TaxID=3039492 RepID=UPI0024BCC0AA|nr:PTS sugar transporter subunit IIB [Lentilactobacillus sp. Marseille-Q4993]
MKIKLARVDTRLLHGQVATLWTRDVNPNRILVVSDSVANDPLRKTLITQVAPADIKANVITKSKFTNIYSDPKFESMEALLLTETVADMLDLIKSGLDLSNVGVNIGNLAYSEGMKMITDTISVDDEIIDQIKEISDQFGVRVYAQTVPNDKKQDILTLL